MSRLSYNQITPKKVILYDDAPHIVLSSHVFRKQQRKPVNITRLRRLGSERVVEVTFQHSASVEEADIETQQVVFIYRTDAEYWFHHAGDPAGRFPVAAATVGTQGRFLKEKMEVSALMFQSNVIGISVPVKVELRVVEAPPAVKGNTSSGATKEIVLETGAPIQAPLFISEGDIVRVNTESGAYAERVEKA